MNEEAANQFRANNFGGQEPRFLRCETLINPYTPKSIQRVFMTLTEKEVLKDVYNESFGFAGYRPPTFGFGFQEEDQNTPESPEMAVKEHLEAKRIVRECHGFEVDNFIERLKFRERMSKENHKIGLEMSGLAEEAHEPEEGAGEGEDAQEGAKQGKNGRGRGDEARNGSEIEYLGDGVVGFREEDRLRNLEIGNDETPNDFFLRSLRVFRDCDMRIAGQIVHFLDQDDLGYSRAIKLLAALVTLFYDAFNTKIRTLLTTNLPRVSKLIDTVLSAQDPKTQKNQKPSSTDTQNDPNTHPQAPHATQNHLLEDQYPIEALALIVSDLVNMTSLQPIERQKDALGQLLATNSVLKFFNEVFSRKYWIDESVFSGLLYAVDLIQQVLIFERVYTKVQQQRVYPNYRELLLYLNSGEEWRLFNDQLMFNLLQDQFRFSKLKILMENVILGGMILTGSGGVDGVEEGLDGRIEASERDSDPKLGNTGSEKFSKNGSKIPLEDIEEDETDFIDENDGKSVLSTHSDDQRSQKSGSNPPATQTRPETPKTTETHHYMLVDGHLLPFYQVINNLTYIYRFQGESKMDRYSFSFERARRRFAGTSESLPEYHKRSALTVVKGLQKTKKIEKKWILSLIKKIQKFESPYSSNLQKQQKRYKRIQTFLWMFTGLNFADLSARDQSAYLSRCFIRKSLQNVDISELKVEALLNLIESDEFDINYFSCSKIPVQNLFNQVLQQDEKVYQRFVKILHGKISDEFYDNKQLHRMIPNFISMIKSLTNGYFKAEIDLSRLRISDFVPFSELGGAQSPEESILYRPLKLINLLDFGEVYEADVSRMENFKFDQLQFSSVMPFELKAKNFTSTDTQPIGRNNYLGAMHNNILAKKIRFFRFQLKREYRNPQKRWILVAEVEDYFQKRIDKEHIQQVRSGEAMVRNAKEVEDPLSFLTKKFKNFENVVLLKPRVMMPISSVARRRKVYFWNYKLKKAPERAIPGRRDFGYSMRKSGERTIDYAAEGKTRKILIKMKVSDLKSRPRIINNLDSEISKRRIRDLRATFSDFDIDAEKPNEDDYRLGLKDKLIRNKIVMKRQSAKVSIQVNFTRRAIEYLVCEGYGQAQRSNYASFYKNSIRFIEQDYAYIYTSSRKTRVKPVPYVSKGGWYGGRRAKRASDKSLVNLGTKYVGDHLRVFLYGIYNEFGLDYSLRETRSRCNSCKEIFVEKKEFLSSKDLGRGGGGEGVGGVKSTQKEAVRVVDDEDLGDGSSSGLSSGVGGEAAGKGNDEVAEKSLVDGGVEDDGKEAKEVCKQFRWMVPYGFKVVSCSSRKWIYVLEEDEGKLRIHVIDLLKLSERL